MPDTPAFLSERLSSEGDKVLAYFETLTPEQWQRQVYTDGAAWMLRQVLAHFVSAERAFRTLVVDIQHGGMGAPEGFDIDDFNSADVATLDELSTGALLQYYRDLRAQTADLVAGLADEDLLRVGRHPFLGVAPLVDIIKLIYRHNQIHLRDIKRVLSDQ